ncbi:MAG: FCD domain-containing protein [Gammaproteobacteria bacterium]|nr:FCD domain-containing protein [Gammaproteobacteria bacterium]
MDVKPVKQKTIVFQVIEQFKELIRSGELGAGDKVPNEYELAKHFEVGRSSIREVMKIFQYLGVVELRNPKGTFVSDSSNISSETLLWSMLLGKKEFSNLIELRMSMEHQGLWYLMYFQKNDAELLDRTLASLDHEVAQMTEAISTNDMEKRLCADYNFHGHIIDICRNDIFNNLYRTMRSFMLEEIRVSQSTLSELDEVLRNHQQLIDAIKNGDYYEATKVFRQHIKDIDNLLK